jgi:hypothetical protein
MNLRYPLYVLCSAMLLLQACDKDDDDPQEDTIPCLPPALSNHVIAFYPFSNGSLNDLSGNNIHLVNNTTAKPAMDRLGNSSCAFEFDNFPNKADSLTTGTVQKLTGLSTFSVSLWYMPLDTAVQATNAKMEMMVSHDKWYVSLYDCRKPNFNYADAGINKGWSVWDTNMTAVTTPNVCQVEQVKRTNVWTHVVVTFDKTNNKAQIYRDGVLRDEDVNYTPAAASPYFNPALLTIGGTFTGRLDDIVIFDKVLSQAEVSQVYQAVACCTQ